MNDWNDRFVKGMALYNVVYAARVVAGMSAESGYTDIKRDALADLKLRLEQYDKIVGDMYGREVAEEG